MPATPKLPDHVRLATLADLPAIVAIYNATVASRVVTADLDPVTVESRVPWFRAHDPRSHPLLVFEHGGEITGWGSLSPFHDRPAYRATAEVSIYIAAAYRGGGRGRGMLQELERACSRLGIDHLVGLVFGHNLPSLSLFERCGYRRWGTLPGVAVLDGIARDLVIVGRELTPCGSG